MVSDIRVREARTEDSGAADLLFESARAELTILAGSEQRARAALADLWGRPGHSMSFDSALVAEIDGRLAGVAVGFPCASRYRRHIALLRAGAGRIPLFRRLVIPPTLAWLVAATPRPSRDCFYIAAIAVRRTFLRRGVATALFDSMGSRARADGFPALAGHTGVRHSAMRSTAERYGFRPTRVRRWGYVLYELDLTE